MTLTQDDLDAVAAAYRLGYLRERSETHAITMAGAALQQRHPELASEEIEALSDVAVSRIKRDRQDWMAGDDVLAGSEAAD